MGRLVSGALVTMNGFGEAMPSCASDIRIFCEKAILRTGVWGERLEIQRAGAKLLRKVKVPASLGVWEQFLAVREGRMANPCPPEVGLRMARLWDAIVASAARAGSPSSRDLGCAESIYLRCLRPVFALHGAKPGMRYGPAIKL